MTEKTTTTIQWPDIRSEAKRLNELGTLEVSFSNDSKPAERRQTLQRARCIGFAIDSQERDCLLFLGPYGMAKRFAVRCIPAKEIEEIVVLGGAPGPRIDKGMTG